RMPAIGVSMSRSFLRPVPYTSEEERISGRMDSGMPMSFAMSSFQSRVSMFISIVREALVTSVTCTPPFGPPVRFHSSHESVLPNSSSPASAFSRAPSTLSRIHLTFGPEKYVASGRPTRSLYLSAPSSPASSSQMRWVRVSCQTIALWTGSPVALSHTTAVSRWLVMPTAASRWRLMSAFTSALPTTARVVFPISFAAGWPQAECGKIWSCSFCPRATIWPAWSKMIARVEVVPWSIDMMYMVWSFIGTPSSWMGGVGGRSEVEDRGDARQGAADHGADDRHPRVSPVGAALVPDRQDGVRQARPEVAGRVDGISRGPAERGTDREHQQRDREGAELVRGVAEHDDHEHEHEGRDDLGDHVPALGADLRPGGEGAQDGTRIGLLVVVVLVGHPGQDRAEECADHLGHEV